MCTYCHYWADGGDYTGLIPNQRNHHENTH
ncbi:hypothetical protein V12B01_12800 [Vibrio splendidus 12B01]|nr:hypothetical protein V12B01_12800 [Vibrio splendidus 12B01]